MGKKPVLGLIGLLWAGIALTGCGECCRNTRNTYNPKSTWDTRDPAVKGPVAEPRGPAELTPARPPVEPGPLSDAKPKFGAPAPAGDKWNAPKSQEALRTPSLRDTVSGELPRAMPTARSSRETAGAPEPKREASGMKLPPAPVRREAASEPGLGRPTDQQPSYEHSKPLPSLEAGPSRAEPAPAAPLPPPGGPVPPPPGSR